MPLDAANNIQLSNARTIDELVRLASLEQLGDQALWIRKFGRSDVLSSDTPEDVWETGGNRALPYTAGEKMSVVSSSANDTFGGTGAQFVQISGLDVDYNLVTDTIAMNGTTPVQSTSDFITVDRSRAVFCGTGQTNAGDITVTGATSGNVNSSVVASESISQQSHFTVPNGYTLFTLDARLSIYRASGNNSARGGEIDQFVYVPAANTTFQTIRLGVTNSGPQNFSPRLVAQTPAKSTLWYRATVDTNNSVVTSSVSYLLLKGDYNLRTEI